jgi:hypothetical protein
MKETKSITQGTWPLLTNIEQMLNIVFYVFEKEFSVSKKKKKKKIVKINLPKFRFIKSLRHTAILNFCANSAWCVKRQNIAGLCQQTLYLCSADIFS